LSAKRVIEEERKSISKKGHKGNAHAFWFNVIGSNKKEGQKDSKNDERKRGELKLMDLICPINIGVYNLFLMIIKTSFAWSPDC